MAALAEVVVAHVGDGATGVIVDGTIGGGGVGGAGSAGDSGGSGSASDGVVL